jgi:hypothetical protein
MVDYLALRLFDLLKMGNDISNDETFNEFMEEEGKHTREENLRLEIEQEEHRMYILNLGSQIPREVIYLVVKQLMKYRYDFPILKTISKEFSDIIDVNIKSVDGVVISNLEASNSETYRVFIEMSIYTESKMTLFNVYEMRRIKILKLKMSTQLNLCQRCLTPSLTCDGNCIDGCKAYCCNDYCINEEFEEILIIPWDNYYGICSCNKHITFILHTPNNYFNSDYNDSFQQAEKYDNDRNKKIKEYNDYWRKYTRSIEYTDSSSDD